MALKTHTPNLRVPRLRVKGRAYYRRTFSSLSYPGYRSFWISLILMMAGVNMQMLARGQLAWDLTHDTRIVALVSAGFAPPILLFSLFGGALADRLDRKKMLQYGQLVIGCIALAVGITIVTEVVSILILMLAGIAQGLVWSFLMPARQAIIPQLVSEKEVSNAVALNASGMALMTLAGPGIGGLAYGLAGPGPTYFIISAMIFISFFLSGNIPIVRVGSAAKRKRQQVFRAVAEGLGYASRNRTILFLLLLVMATTMSSMSFRSLMPAYVDIQFGGNATLLGLLMSMIGVGALFGSLFIAGLSAGVRKGIVLLAATAMSATAILVSAFIAILFVSIVAMMLLGLGDSGRRSLNASLLMEQSDEEHRGRIMGIYMLNFGLTPLAAIPLGFLAEATSIQLAFGIAGAGLALAVVLSALLTPRIRRL